MRELKFRVWNGENMISPDYIKRNGTAHWSENSIPQCSVNIMQSTGSKDKHGTEIYEGDIVEVQGTKKVGLYLTEIVFTRQGFELKENNTVLRDHVSFAAIRIVVGNIYENPEIV